MNEVNVSRKNMLDDLSYNLTLIDFMYKKSSVDVDVLWSKSLDERLNNFATATFQRYNVSINDKIRKINEETTDKLRVLFKQLEDFRNKWFSKVKPPTDEQLQKLHEVETALVKFIDANGTSLDTQNGTNSYTYMEYSRLYYELMQSTATSARSSIALCDENTTEILDIFKKIDGILTSRKAYVERLLQAGIETQRLLSQLTLELRKKFDAQSEIVSRFWGTQGEKVYQRVDLLQNQIERAVHTVPLSEEAEKRFFEIIYSESFNQETSSERSRLIKEINEICSTPSSLLGALPYGFAVLKHNSENGGRSYKVPLALDFDRFYYFDRAENKAGEVADLFDTLTFEALREEKAGKLDVVVVDPEGKGAFFTKYHKFLTSCRKNQGKTQVICEQRDFENFINELSQETGERAASLGSEHTVATSNAQENGVRINRKLILINSISTYYKSSASSADRIIDALCDVANNAHKCGFTIVCCDDEQFWTRLQTSKPRGFDSITRLALPVIGKESATKVVRLDGTDFEVKDVNAIKITDDNVKRLFRFLDWAIKAESSSVDFRDVLNSERFGLFDRNSSEAVYVPFGRDVSGKNAYWIGATEGYPGQTLIVGETGSGKSNLMRAIIASACYYYSPQELQLYLIDLKAGVEFKRYAEHKLPHAKLVAIESSREIAVGVLRDVKECFEKRSAVFREQNVADLTSYRQKNASDPKFSNLDSFPRIVVVIDEFTKLFELNDQLYDEAAALLRGSIISQGRSAGIHVILGTQNLHGIPNGIITQATTRLALKCADAALNGLFDASTVARQMQRNLRESGEGVLLFSGMEPQKFRAAYMNQEVESTILQEISEQAKKRGLNQRPLVFDGTAFAKRDDENFPALLKKCVEPEGRCVLLGESTSLTNGVFAPLQRDMFQNFLIVGNDRQNSEIKIISAIWGMIATSARELARISRIVVYIWDSQDMISENWGENVEVKRVNVNERPADLIIEVYRKMKELQRTKKPEIVFLILTRAEGLRNLTEYKFARTERTPQKTLEAQSEKSTSRFDYSVLQPASHMNGRQEENKRNDPRNAIEALQLIMKNGGESGIYTFIGCGASSAIADNLEISPNRIRKSFAHVICSRIDEAESQNCLGNLDAAKLDANYAIYRNLNDVQMQKFRPFESIVYEKPRNNDAQIA